MRTEVSDLARTESEKGLAGERAPGKSRASGKSRDKLKADLGTQIGFPLRNLYDDVLNRSVPDPFHDPLEQNSENAALDSGAVLPFQLHDFDLAVARLSQLSDMLNGLAEESRRDIVLMSSKRDRLDRLMSDNDVRLQRLTEHT
jgi:hypothetical protein